MSVAVSRVLFNTYVPFLLCQVDSAEFIHCKEMVDEYLRSLEFCLPTNAVYIFDSARIQEEQSRSPPRRAAGLPERGDPDEYYDGLGRLYDEEVNPGAQGGGAYPQGSEVSPCPPLHPAVN